MFDSRRPACAQVKVTARQGRLEHGGVKVQLLGVIELMHAGVRHHEFLSLCAPLTL